MIDLFQKQRGNSILGLAFDGNRLDGVVLRRSNGSARLAESFSATLALDVLTADPQLFGRELRNQLDKAEIRERRCAVCIPLNWALTLQTKFPAELPESDSASFLQIEAEKHFPANYETLSIDNSRVRIGDEYFVTLIAIPKAHLLRLESALRAARLIPVSFSIGVAALQSPIAGNANGVLALVMGNNTLDLQITSGGGVAAFRPLDGVFEMEGALKKIDADALAREIRITLGQLPNVIRETVRKVKIFGRGDAAQKLSRDLSRRIDAFGMEMELVEKFSAEKLEGSGGRDATVTTKLDACATPTAAALALQIVLGQRVALEFLPERINQWQQITARISSKKLGWVGAAAGVIGGLILAVFLVQQIQLTVYQSRWDKIRTKVEELDASQQNIRKFRPWFDESFRSLTILKKLTDAFPEDGSVTAKTVELREPSTVTCSGTAKSRTLLLKVCDKLSATSGVRDVHIETRGSSPLQFTFNFQWEGDNAN